MNDARVAKGEPHMYWLEAIFRVLMLAFGGGTCIPIVLGMRPFPFANDAAVFLTALAFWLVHYFPHDIVYTAYKENQALKGLFWFLEVMRCNVIIVWLKKAHIAIPPWGGRQILSCGNLWTYHGRGDSLDASVDLCTMGYSRISRLGWRGSSKALLL